jgi:hypothetical protein
MLDDYF